MFCHKCGTKTLDGAEFCQKCGAKLIADTPVEQSKSAPPASPPQWPNSPPGNISGKKRSKLPTILGIAAGIAIVLIVLAAIGNKEGSDTDVIADNSDAPSEFGTQSAEVPGSTTTDSLLFQGTPIQDIMGAHSSDIIALFGEPKTQSEDSIEYGVEFTEEGWMCFCLDNADQVNVISADPLHFTFDGQSLAQNFDTLVTILGNDYTDMGGTAYSWQVFWNYSDYQIYFTFPRDSDDDKPHSIDIMMSDSATPADDDDYSWVEGDIEGLDPTIDSSLNGRWRSNTGSYMELKNGNIRSINFRVWQVLDRNPDDITWTTDNGRLTFRSRFDSTYEYKITHGKMYSWDEDRDWLQFTQDGRRVMEPLERIEGDIGDGLIGKWGIGHNAYDFNTVVIYADGTGSMGGKDMSWYSDDTTFSYTFYQTSSYDYYVLGDTLTLYSSSGSTVYTRVGD